MNGRSKGIGFACAEAILLERATVAICSRNPSNIDAALNQRPGAVGYAKYFSYLNVMDPVVKRMAEA